MKKEGLSDDKKVTKRESDLVTKESLCAVCALFSLIALFILCTRALIFGDIGLALHALLIGLFGYAAYPVMLGALYLSVTGLLGVRLVKNRKLFACMFGVVFCALLIVHTATTYAWETQGYVAKCFRVGEQFPNATAFGFVGGVLVWLVSLAMTKAGAIVIFSLLTAFFGYLTYVCASKGVQQSTSQQPVGMPAPVEIPLNAPQTAQAYAGQKAVVTEPSMPVEIAPAQSMQYSNEQPQAAFMGGTVQTPTFTLSDEPTVSQPLKQTSGAFSPFGRVQDMKPIEQPSGSSYENTREFLFGVSPAENYQRNLIFDANANVNKRRLDATPAPVQSNGYNSYVDAYQDSINNSDRVRPQMVFGNDQNQPLQASEPTIAPLEPLPTQPISSVEPIAPVQPTERTSYLEEKAETYTPSYRQETVQDDVLSTREEPVENVEREEPARRHEYMDLFSPQNPNVFGDAEEDRAFADQTFSRRSMLEEPTQEIAQLDARGIQEKEEMPTRGDFERDNSRLFEESIEETRETRRGIDIFDSEERTPQTDDLYTLRSEEPRVEQATETQERNTRFETEERNDAFETSTRTFTEPKPAPKAVEPPKQEEVAPAPPKPRVIRPYVRVPIDDFDCRDVEPMQDPQVVEEIKETIIATLEDFKVSGASIASVTFGPTVTRYNVTIPRNISPRKVVSLDQSIAISLRCSGVNVYPNYEDGVVSIEVPNQERQFVQLGCMLTGNTFVNANPSSLMFTMGKDVANRKVYGDISKMTHLLVAGSSGSGKSVFLGSLIISLIYKYSPEELRLILIDPKKTEFVLYNNLPHLMIDEIITDVHKSVQSLNWAIGEMNRRYSLFEKMSRAGTYVVNLDQYNAQLKKEERLPKIVIIIDELADLMLAAKKDIEDRIQNLTQKARAAGIHLVVATQRPSTDVITGVIKSNLATRIAFAVATDVDSRVILDQSGAQKLLGKGDFLYTMQGINTPVRVQSAFISSEDSQKVVNYIKANNEAYYDQEATAFINNSRGGGNDARGGGDEVEPVYIDALRYVILSENASISMIQRTCSVGFNKAGKIVEWMEEMGYISGFEGGSKARKVLISREEFESKYGSL